MALIEISLQPAITKEFTIATYSIYHTSCSFINRGINFYCTLVDQQLGIPFLSFGSLKGVIIALKWLSKSSPLFALIRGGLLERSRTMMTLGSLLKSD